jgi:hypothetical protein
MQAVPSAIALESVVTPNPQLWKWNVVLAASLIASLGLGLGALTMSVLSILQIMNSTHLNAEFASAMLFASLCLLVLAAHSVDRLNDAQNRLRKKS